MTKTESVNFNISKRYTGSSAVMQHVYCKKKKITTMQTCTVKTTRLVGRIGWGLTLLSATH